MTGPIGYDELRVDTVVQVAKLMAGAAITAPKSGGQLFLAGKHNFMETVIVEDPTTRHELAECPPSSVYIQVRRSRGPSLDPVVLAVRRHSSSFVTNR